MTTLHKNELPAEVKEVKKSESAKESVPKIEYICENHDVILRFKTGESLMVSKAVLSRHSPVLKSMFEIGTGNEIEIAETFAVVQQIMRHIHVPAYASYDIAVEKGGLLMDLYYIQKLLLFCDKYGMDSVLNSIATKLKKLASPMQYGKLAQSSVSRWISLLGELTQKGHISLLRAAIIRYLTLHLDMSPENYILMFKVLTKDEIVAFSSGHRDLLIQAKTPIIGAGGAKSASGMFKFM